MRQLYFITMRSFLRNVNDLLLSDFAGILGNKPLMQNDLLTEERDVGKDLEATCDIVTGLTSAILQLNWYRLTDGGKLVSVNTLPGHYVSSCFISK